MNFIDISEINNFWMVYLMPFSDEDKKKKKVVEGYQEYCKNNNIFGMGWGNSQNNELIDLFSGKSMNLYDSKVNEKLIESYKQKYKKLNNNTVSETVIKEFKNIKENDLVITRLRNGKYCIGQVKKEKDKEGVCFYSDGSDKKIIDTLGGSGTESGMSWCCYVDKWKEFDEQDMPEDIIGRFSQRYHSTIQRIADDRIKLLMINLLNKDNINAERPKITLNENNFARALNYKELEDLVCEYILDIHKEYKLLPSKCKISKPNYEFDLINTEKIKDKYITCQVKNLEKVLYTDYIEDADNDKFKKIYLFSGLGQYNENKEEKTNEESTYDERGNVVINNIITIISKENLFEFFKNSLTLKEILSKKSCYYYVELEDDTEIIDEIQRKLKAGKYEITKKYSRNKKQYKLNINCIEFNQIPNFYYYGDFKVFIKKCISDEDESNKDKIDKDEIENKINEILEIVQ